MGQIDALSIRTFDPKCDGPFIFSTWLNNYKHSSYFAKRIPNSVFFAGHHKVIEHILAKPSTQVWIASSKADASLIFGYLVCEKKAVDSNDVVHFCFVKDAFRNLGVAKQLFHAANISMVGTRFTHWVFPMDDLIIKFPELVYDPYSL